jgi:hypothetical protein
MAEKKNTYTIKLHFEFSHLVILGPHQDFLD